MSLGLVYFDWVCLQGSLYSSDFVVKLTLPCPRTLSIHFYATSYLEGKPKTQHLKAFFPQPRDTCSCCRKSPPRTVTSRSCCINTLPFLLHSQLWSCSMLSPRGHQWDGILLIAHSGNWLDNTPFTGFLPFWLFTCAFWH